MIIDLDAVPGCVTVRGPDEALGTANDVVLTPRQARNYADKLDGDGLHTVIANGLRNAAAEAQRRR